MSGPPLAALRRRARGAASMRPGRALLLVALAACSGGGEAGGAGGASGEGDAAAEPAAAAALISSFDVGVRGDTVRFSLRVSNAAEEPVVLDFATGQRFDFEVRDSAGNTAWQWSADRMFTQAMESDTLAPGAVWTYEATWVPAVGPGEYMAAARLLAVRRAVELETVFELRDP